jgi:ribosomal protein S15P/S13E
MFLENKYTKWYNSIIENAKLRNVDGYLEKHHILPKCLGGLDNTENIVKLSAREHFICHWLLTKMIDKTNKRKVCQMLNAFNRMFTNNDNQYRYTSKLFEHYKKNASKTMSSLWEVPETRERLIENINNIWAARKGDPEKFKEYINKRSKTRKATLDYLKENDPEKYYELNKSRKTWEIVTPCGSIEIVTDLKAFCRLNSLNYCNMTKLGNKNHKNYYYLGYKCSKVERK